MRQSEKQEKPYSLRELFRFYKPERFAIGGAVVFTALGSAARMVWPLIIAFLVDVIFHGEPAKLPGFLMDIYEDAGGREFFLNNLIWFGVIIVGITLLWSLFDYAGEMLMVRSTEKGAERMRRSLFAHLQQLPYSWHAHAETGDLVQRCTTDVDTIRRFFQFQFIQIIFAGTMVIISVVVMFTYDLVMSLIAVSITPILFVTSFRYFKERRRTFEDWDEAEGALSARLQESVTGVRVVKAFGREAFENEKFTEKNDFLKNYSIKAFEAMGKFWFWSDLLCFTELALIVIIGTIRVIDGNLTLGTLLIFISYSSNLLFPLRGLARMLADMGKADISYGRLREIWEAAEEPNEDHLKAPELSGDIKFEHVGFTYPDGKLPVLEDINLHIRAGETVGFLGATGSGKSSLLLLLQKLYLPTEGRILLDDIDITEINRDSVRRQIGLILQESYIYSRSIGENIGLTDPNASQKDIEKYAEIAHLHKDIKEFGEGYRTVVGERGVTLSGGQKQRLAIARTLIRDCPVLIFDDSLSAVDTDTDREIRKSLKQRPDGVTTLIVSHRISTLSDADRIYVLENNTIEDCGTHEELIAREGLYKRVYDIQHDWVNEKEVAG